MIVGIGCDIVQTKRLSETLARTGTRFAQRILGSEELAEYHRRQEHVEARGLHYLCNRFAAKEAFSKALGLGMREPMSWHAIQILNEANGQPIIKTSGALAEYMQNNQFSARVTLSDEVDYSLAFVVVEKHPSFQPI